MTRLIKLAGLLAVVFALVGTSVASDAKTDALIRRVYPIGDLPVMTIKGDFNAAILVACIESAVDPESWMSSGIGNGELQPFPEKLCLVVSQTEDNHEKIASLMERLRSEAKGKISQELKPKG